MFDQRIDKYLDLHPTIIRTKGDATLIRSKVFKDGRKTRRGANKRTWSGDDTEEEEEEKEEDEEDSRERGGATLSLAKKVRTAQRPRPIARQKASAAERVGSARAARKPSRPGSADDGDDSDDDDADRIPAKRVRKTHTRRNARQQKATTRVKPVQL